ncbi:Rv2253/PknI dimerization domain-containing protein [Mycolicibacterium helvum]
MPATRSDYWIPNPDGSFFGERTLVIGGAGCPDEGPGTHWLPISLTPA